MFGELARELEIPSTFRQSVGILARECESPVAPCKLRIAREEIIVFNFKNLIGLFRPGEFCMSIESHAIEWRATQYINGVSTLAPNDSGALTECSMPTASHVVWQHVYLLN